MNQPSQSFPKTLRLVRGHQFDKVYRQGRVVSDETLVIHAIANGLSITRLGLSVSKRVGNAPVRNRWKRLIREAFRLRSSHLPLGLDLVVRPRKGASPEFPRVWNAIADLVPKLALRLHRRTEND
jgi:ribonuclease P protein component